MRVGLSRPRFTTAYVRPVGLVQVAALQPGSRNILAVLAVRTRYQRMRHQVLVGAQTPRTIDMRCGSRLRREYPPQEMQRSIV